MCQILIITVIICLIGISSAQSFSILYNWTVPIETSNSQGAPYITQLGKDNVVLAFFQQTVNSEPLKLSVHTYNISSGKRTSVCQIDTFFNPIPFNFNLYNLKLNEYAESNIVLSYVIYDQQKKPTLKVHVIDVINCSTRVRAIDVEPTMTKEFAEFPYSILPHKEAIDIFVSSLAFCKGELCRLSLNESNDLIKKPFKTITLKGFWEIVPINSNDSEGFYHLAKNYNTFNNPTLIVTRLSSNGKVLKSIETYVPFEEKKTFSNAYGNLGFCSQKSVDNALNCLLLDSSLNIKLSVNNAITKNYIFPTYTVLNTKFNGMLLTNTFYSINYIFMFRNEYKTTEVVEVKSNGEFAKPFGLFKSEFEPFINKHYQGFVNERDGTYCTAIAHVKHVDVGKTYYKTSVDFKCIKIE